MPSARNWIWHYFTCQDVIHCLLCCIDVALRYTTTDVQWKESAIRLTNAMVNAHAIINHFNPKIESWTTARNLSSLTEEQVIFTVYTLWDVVMCLVLVRCFSKCDLLSPTVAAGKAFSCICLSCLCSNFWKHWPRNFIFGTHVHLQNISVMFICQGHRMKVKVARAKNVIRT